MLVCYSLKDFDVFILMLLTVCKVDNTGLGVYLIINISLLVNMNKVSTQFVLVCG